MVSSMTCIMLPAPWQKHGDCFHEKMAVQNTASILPVFLQLLSVACLKTALASLRGTFLLTMKLAAAATFHLMDELQRSCRGQNWAYVTAVDALLKPLMLKENMSTTIKDGSDTSILFNYFAAPYCCYVDIRYFAFTTMEIFALQYFQPAVGKHAEGSTQGTYRLTVGTRGESTTESVCAFVVEERSPEICKVCIDNGFILGPDMDAILRSKETAQWLVTAKNNEDDDDDDDDDLDDLDEDEDADDADKEVGEEGEGEEHEEADDDADEDADDADEDADDADEEVGEEGEGEEHEEADDDADEEEGGEDDEGDEDDLDEDDEDDLDEDDEDDLDEDDDEDDDDEDDKEESPEPPKKRKK